MKSEEEIRKEIVATKDLLKEILTDEERDINKTWLWALEWVLENQLMGGGASR